MSNKKNESTEVVSGIYKITNIENNKVYIGSSKDIYQRWTRHRSDLSKNKHHSIHLQRAWNKFGENKFIFEILEECPDTILFEKEQEWYNHFKCWNDEFGYNCSKVAKCPLSSATLDSLKAGKHTITYEQFGDIVDLLCNTDISIPEIAKITNSPERTIYQIYYKEQYANLTQDCSFIKRLNKGAHVLNESEVKEIIELLKQNDFSSDIAKKYGVGVSTIDDIRNHKTWKYLTQDVVFDSIAGRTRVLNNKPVCQFSLDGKYMRTFSSAREVEKELGIGFKQISQVCNRHKRMAHGFIWRFEGDSFDKYETQNTNFVKVDQYSKDGKYIRSYDSITEASLSVGVKINSAIQGITKSSGGYYWSRHGEIPLPLLNNRVAS